MSLTHIKKSLNAIKSLKRTTGAMRVLSMSLHSLARKKTIYNQKIIQKLENILDVHCNGTLDSKSTSKLLIVIGSQRGLCGKYNQKIKHFYTQLATHDYKTIIIIGKKLAETLEKFSHQNNIISIPNFSLTNLEGTLDLILKHSREYKTIDIIYTHSKNLFTHDITKKTISMSVDCNTKTHDTFSNYQFEKNTLDQATHKIILFYQRNLIKGVLYNALESEQAIRFLSMDKAFKNSSEIIHKKQVLYNKLHHEKINKELLDIITGCMK